MIHEETLLSGYQFVHTEKMKRLCQEKYQLQGCVREMLSIFLFQGVFVQDANAAFEPVGVLD